MGRTPEEAADALAELLRGLNIVQIDLIGVSAAGPTALAFAQGHTGKLRKLVLESAVATPWPADAKRRARLLFGAAQAVTWSALRFALKVANAQTLRVMIQELTTLPIDSVMARMTQEDLAFVARMLEASNSGTGFLLDLEHRIEHLHGIIAPTLVMHSKHDKAVPLANAERVVAAVPTSELYTVPCDTHLIWMGASAPEVRQKRLDFLNSSDDAA